jgi:hypothetical protein
LPDRASGSIPGSSTVNGVDQGRTRRGDKQSMRGLSAWGDDCIPSTRERWPGRRKEAEQHQQTVQQPWNGDESEDRLRSLQICLWPFGSGILLSNRLSGYGVRIGC